MNEQTDSQLLRQYAGNHSEPAFSELVRRHLDFVYSAALRMVCDAHLAEDVTQAVFMALAKGAARLSERQVLSSWLHCTAQNIAAQTVRSIERRRAREQEAAAMNQLLAIESDPSRSAGTEADLWKHIVPHLDAALGELSEPDRDAVLLRYFENKSLREIGQVLGTSDDTAQKRVSRAVEHLRAIFAKRGVTVGASGLLVALSANAVQAAPVGLAATISTAAALAGTTTIASAATATATKAIAMTTLQKTIIGGTLALALGTGIYETHLVSRLRKQNQILQQQQAPLAEQIQQLNRTLTEATNQVATLREDNERLSRNTSELLKLRGEIARMRRDSEELAALKATIASDPTAKTVNRWLDNVTRLKQRLQQTPAAYIPELQSLTEEDWLKAAKEDLNTDTDYRKALSKLRYSVEAKYASQIETAVKKFSDTHGGQMPTDLSQLKPCFKTPIDDAILQRYQLVPADSLPTITLPGVGGWVVTQKAAVDLEYDTRIVAARTDAGTAYGGSGSFEQSEMVKSLTPAIKAYFAANNQATLTDPAQLTPYATTSDAQAALEKAIKYFADESPKSRTESLKRLERLRPK